MRWTILGSAGKAAGNDGPAIASFVKAVAVSTLFALVAGSCASSDESTRPTENGEAAGRSQAVPADQTEFDEDLVLAQSGMTTVASGSSYGVTPGDVSIESMVPTDELMETRAVSLATGADITVAGEYSGRLRVTVPLPERSSESDVPAVLHLHDDGSFDVLVGVLSDDETSITVWTDSFSRFFGGYWNPANLVIDSAVYVGEKAVDGSRYAGEKMWDGATYLTGFLWNWARGRHDAPACGDDPPEWGVVSALEVTMVHVCAQANPLSNGTERVEVFLRSNRNTLQMVSVPAGADYVWVQGQPESVRNVAATAMTLDTNPQAVVLFGGQSMSFGFTRPANGKTVEVRTFQTTQTNVANHVLGALGGLDAKGALATALAGFACVSEVAGIDFTEFSGPADDIDDAGEAALGCALELLADPDAGAGVVAESMRGVGASQTAVDRAVSTFKSAVTGAISKTADRTLKAFDAFRGFSRLYDQYFDARREQLIRVDLIGAGGAETPSSPLVSDPATSGEVVAAEPDPAPVGGENLGPMFYERFESAEDLAMAFNDVAVDQIKAGSEVDPSSVSVDEQLVLLEERFAETERRVLQLAGFDPCILNAAEVESLLPSSYGPVGAVASADVGGVECSYRPASQLDASSFETTWEVSMTFGVSANSGLFALNPESFEPASWNPLVFSLDFGLDVEGFADLTAFGPVDWLQVSVSMEGEDDGATGIAQSILEPILDSKAPDLITPADFPTVISDDLAALVEEQFGANGSSSDGDLPPAGDRAPDQREGGKLTSCEGLDTGRATFGNEYRNAACSWPWALVHFDTGMPTIRVNLINTENTGYVVASFFDVEDGQQASGYSVAALIEAGVPDEVAVDLFTALGV